jgi:hypothetical protein
MWLSEHLQGLIADEFVYVRSRQPYGPTLELSEDAVDLARTIAGDENLKRKIELLAAKLGRKGVDELERLATALYVNGKQGWHSPLAQRAAMLTALKPHVRSDAARSAFLEIDQIQKGSSRVAA